MIDNLVKEMFCQMIFKENYEKIKAAIMKEKFCVSISFPDQLMRRKCGQEFSITATLLQLRKRSQISTYQFTAGFHPIPERAL